MLISDSLFLIDSTNGNQSGIYHALAVCQVLMMQSPSNAAHWVIILFGDS